MTTDEGPGAQEEPRSEAAAGRSAPWAQHAGQIVSALGLLVISTQLLAIAGFDLTTASFILDERGVGNVGIALLMNLVPGLAPMAASYMTLLLVRRRRTRPLGSVALLINTFLWALSLYVAPWWLTAGAILVAIIMMPTSIREAEGTSTKYDRVLDRISVASIGFLLAPIVTSVATVLPTENLKPSGGEAFAGIVLGEHDPELVVLRLEDRQVVRITKEGTTQAPCKSGASLSFGLPEGDRSIMSLRQPKQTYPGCLPSS